MKQKLIKLFRFIQRCGIGSENNVGVFAKIRSIWLQSKFKHCGKGTFIQTFSQLLNPQLITIGENTSINKGCWLTAWIKNEQIPEIIIGDNVAIGPYNHITATNRIEIGSGVLTGKWVTITDNSHGTTDKESLLLRPSQREIYSKGKVKIEDDVWIGDKVTILPGVTIGKGCVIGANAVVTKDVPSYSVIVGNPARIIK